MSDNQSPKASLLNSIIGEGTRFNGEFDLNGLLRIDGDFTGTIRTNGQIIVGLNGRAVCNLYADSVVIGGIVRGNVFTTDKVVILSTGMMIGNIRTPRLIVEEGVVYNGNCKITAHQSDAVQAAATAETASSRTLATVASERRAHASAELSRTAAPRPRHASAGHASAGHTSAGHFAPHPRQNGAGSKEKSHPTEQLRKVTDDESSSDNDRQDSVTSRN